MARKQLLDDDQVDFLKTRVLISRYLGAFSLRKITTNWSISLATLHRYKSPQYRQASRDYAHRAYIEYREEHDPIHCYSCHEILAEHPRCAGCTILLHNGEPTCESDYCIDTGLQSILPE